MAQFDAKQVPTNDWGVIGGGALVLIASVLPWYGVSASFFSTSVNGWNSGIRGWFSVLLCIAAAGIVLARNLGVRLPTMPVGQNLALAAATGLAALLILWLLIDLPSGRAGGQFAFSYGARIGIWLALLGATVQTAFSVLSARRAGEALPRRGASPAAPPTT